MSNVLLVAATEDELCGHEGLVCGIGPVEAAITTARSPQRSPRAVLNIGIAGARGSLPAGSSSEARPSTATSRRRFSSSSGSSPTADCSVPCVRRFEALVLPIGTSAAVGGSPASSHRNIRVEGMEGFAVLRACAVAGVPAIEVRAISNEIAEGDRSRWRIGRALEAISDVLPRLIAAAE